MRRVFWILLAAGCSYNNPWDTSGNVADYQEQRQADLEAHLITPYAPPQREPATPVDADLEGWRDTVLAVADDATLARMRADSARKVGDLESRRRKLLRMDPHTRNIPLTEVEEQLRVEKLRLQMIDERPGTPRRSD